MDALRLINLRSFADTGWMDIKPLTLLVGRNSSGKSTIARFFPLMRQSVGARTRGPLLWNGDDVDFGSLEEVRRRGAVGPVAYGQRWSGVEGVDGPVSVMVELDESDTVNACEAAWAGKSYCFQRGDRLEGASSTDVGTIAVELVNAPVLPMIRISPSPVSRLPQEQKAQVDSEVVKLSVEAMGVLNQVQSEVLLNLPELSYLGPFRQLPRRFYRDQNLDISSLDPMGSNLPFLLADLSKAKLADLSAWLLETFGFRIELVDLPRHLQVRVITADGVADNLMDVGFGYTQLLPVAVQLWMQSQQAACPSIMVLEEPDLHLHPALQDRVGAALARAAAARGDQVRLIIETHSHFLINAVGAAVGSGQLCSDQVSVLRVEKGADGISTVYPTTFDADGLLQDWPVGFFLPDADLS